mmetsp:Transcript_38315/g.70845  ORF Transcript_38315/g.70845 Transcript_38315/m.70845 type:complete len:287 (+) Transcript_38315:1087-1947(+)
MDIACAIMHLVEHGLPSSKLLCFGFVCGRSWRRKTEAARGICSHLNESVETFCIDATIAICVCLSEAMKQKAVQLLVLWTVLTLAGLQDPLPEVFLASLPLALGLTKQSCLLTDMLVDVIQPMVEIDEASILAVNALEELHASLHFLLWSLIKLSHCWGKAKTPGHVRGYLHHVIKVSCDDFTIKVHIRIRETLQQKLIELMILDRVTTLSGPLQESNEALSAVFCHGQANRLLKLIQCLRFLANVCVAKAQPSLEVDVAGVVVHLVEHGFPSGELFCFVAICRRH